MALATTPDVEQRLGRSLSVSETSQAGLWLNDVERSILRRIPDAVTRAGTDEIFFADMVAVETAVVVRELRNPEGFYTESEGEYSYARARSWTEGGPLGILASEWKALG